MLLVKLKPLLVVIIGLGMSTAIFAQESNMRLQLLRNPALLNKFEAGADAPVAAASDIPSAASPRAQNTYDLRLQKNSDAKLTAVEAGTSVIENYYKILTGYDLSVYGSTEFSQGQDDSLLFFNTFGKEYRLAPGDILRINLRGFVESNGSYKVTRDGKIILTNLPPIDVVGISVGDVKRKILDLLQLGDASASAYVSLDTGRLVTVQISGGVELPRTVAIPAYTPLSRILGHVGGLSAFGSLRNISLISYGSDAEKVDFYDFLQNPLGGFDPLITTNSRIFVGNMGATVAASGFVARNGIYELPLGQFKIKVKDLLELSVTNLIPPGAVIEALYFDEKGVARSRIVTVDGEINAGESLNIRFVNTRNTNVISLRGAVVEEYNLTSSKPLSLIDILKGGAVLSQQAELSLAVVYGPNINPYVLDINQELRRKKSNFEASQHKVEPNSTIYVLSKSEYANLIASGGQKLKIHIKINEGVGTSLALNPDEQMVFSGETAIYQPIDLEQEAALTSLLLAKKVSVYLDGKLNVILAPNTPAIDEPKLTALATGFDVYPLYIGFNRYDEKTRVWRYLQLKSADLFDPNRNVIFDKNDHLNFYSTSFINQLGSGIVSNEDTLELDQTVSLVDGSAQAIIKEAFSSTDQGVNALLNSARNIFGAVDRPGAYPIAGSATLSEILSVAGGTVDGADLSEVKIIKYEIKNGRLLAGDETQIDIENRDTAKIMLEGQYTVMVPFLVNDASSGAILVSGEVLQPGEYIFSRTETLQEVIEKAGGLSSTAYPLGVVLSREAVREQQREANRLLASEVEASVLQLSQSDISGARNQVQAILGFAERLRNQEVMGRLTVNVLVSDPSAPVFLEDGDEVFVPKRPSYVSVIGSVQKETMASYSTNKSFADYIAAAGGLNRGADKRSIYVLLPNGESIKASQDVLIPPGAVVVVPPKTDKLSILGLTDIISRVMGNIATSVLAINNVN